MTIIDWQMGGNCAYNKTLGRLRAKKRTHREYHDRIDGHKILLQNRNETQAKLPVNSNSESPIYLAGKKIGEDLVIVTTIGIYQDHKCVGQIDLKFDRNGDFIPFAPGNKESSHFHFFKTDPLTGLVSRISGDKNNHHPIDVRYNALIHDIVNYNKKHKHESNE